MGTILECAFKIVNCITNSSNRFPIKLCGNHHVATDSKVFYNSYRTIIIYSVYVIASIFICLISLPGTEFIFARATISNVVILATAVVIYRSRVALVKRSRSEADIHVFCIIRNFCFFYHIIVFKGIGAGLEPMQPVRANIIRADSTMQMILLFMSLLLFPLAPAKLGLNSFVRMMWFTVF